MQKTNINPRILQPFFESAANAAEKGQSQFFTPRAFGERLAAALPKCRPALVDLNCGAGDLLQASANETTATLFGCDIDEPGASKEARDDQQTPNSKLQTPKEKTPKLRRDLPVKHIQHDLTLLYGLLRDVEFEADLFVLNPPWRLFWWRERLAALADAKLSAVRDAYAAQEAGAKKGTLDSTIATLMIALDRCTSYGEGLLIANNNTLDRLLFREGAPYAALARHVWARVIVPGNPMTGIQDCQWEEGEQFYTGVIYFAREHTTGLQQTLTAPAQPSTFNPQLIPLPDRAYRMGADVRDAYFAHDPREQWQGAREAVAELAGTGSRVPWNLWLSAAGTIRTDLSLFQKLSRKVSKAEVERLFALRGKTPMELVLQRNQRDELLHVARDAGWRVHPELIRAVDAAIADYHQARSPLYPLPEIQRLGYLDEQDSIPCREDLNHPDGRLLFKAGHDYLIRTQTVNVKRLVRKPNPFTGEMEDLEFEGQELAIFLNDAAKKDGQFVDRTEVEGDEFCFMDAKLKDDENTKISSAKKQKKDKARVAASDHAADRVAVDFTLQDLCAHFIIPEVPDVATLNPEGYKQNLDALAGLEQLTEELAA